MASSDAYDRAEALQEELLNAIEDVSDEARDKCEEFLESVTEKAAGIVATVSRTNVLTAKQEETMENMIAGVNKWIH